MPAEVMWDVAYLELNRDFTPAQYSFRTPGTNTVLHSVNVNFLFPGCFSQVWKVLGTTSTLIAQYTRTLSDPFDVHPFPSSTMHFDTQADSFIVTLTTAYIIVDTQNANLSIFFKAVSGKP